MNLKFFFNKGAFLEFQDFSLIVFNLNLMILDYVYDLIKKFFKMFDWQLMIRANRFFTCLVETATAKLVTKALIMDNPNFWGNSKKKNKAKINWNRINAWYFWISTNSKIYFNHQIYYMFFSIRSKKTSCLISRSRFVYQIYLVGNRLILVC